MGSLRTRGRETSSGADALRTRGRETLNGGGRGFRAPRRARVATTDQVPGGVVLGIGAVCSRETSTPLVVNHRPDSRAVGGSMLLRSKLARLGEEPRFAVHREGSVRGAARSGARKDSNRS